MNISRILLGVPLVLATVLFVLICSPSTKGGGLSALSRRDDAIQAHVDDCARAIEDLKLRLSAVDYADGGRDEKIRDLQYMVSVLTQSANQRRDP